MLPTVVCQTCKLWCKGTGSFDRNLILHGHGQMGTFLSPLVSGYPKATCICTHSITGVITIKCLTSDIDWSHPSSHHAPPSVCYPPHDADCLVAAHLPCLPRLFYFAAADGLTIMTMCLGARQGNSRYTSRSVRLRLLMTTLSLHSMRR